MVISGLWNVQIHQLGFAALNGCDKVIDVTLHSFLDVVTPGWFQWSWLRMARKKMGLIRSITCTLQNLICKAHSKLFFRFHADKGCGVFLNQDDQSVILEQLPH